MAQLLLAGHGRVPESLGAYLREALPDDTIVVADPVVRRREIGAIVIGSSGLVIIDATASSPPGCDAHGSDAEAMGAVQSFLAEEFPTLQLPVRYCLALAPLPRVTTWAATGHAAWRVVEPDGMAGQDLADAISAASEGASPLADAATREALAVAFRDRQITPSQRTTQPFVFRSGGLFLGSPQQAWTIRDVIQHMDRHWEDGVYHLRNRTLEQWLSCEGAAHLAALARAAGDRCFDDPRGSLEEFLVSTGLVARPAPVMRPRRLDLGYVLAGESATGQITIRAGKGAGYLLGHVETSDPCLRAAPGKLSGESVKVAVTLDTTDLLIQPGPCEVVVAAHTAGRAEPQTAPVRFRVAPVPSVLSRYAIRPLIGLLAGGILGMLVGAAWWLNTVTEPIRGTSWVSAGSLVFWVLLFGALWAILGGFRGFLQPPAWPTSYALLRWFYAVLIWAGALGVFGATAVWCWYQGFLGGAGLQPGVMWIAVHYGVALAIVPATLQELLAAQQRSGLSASYSRPQIGRRLAWAIASAGLLATLAVAPVFLRPMWERATQRDTLAALERLALEGWRQADLMVNDLVRQFYFYAYDRRPPATSAPASSAGDRR